MFNLDYGSEALRKCARQKFGVRKGSWEPVESETSETGSLPDYENTKAIIYDSRGVRRGRVTKYDLLHVND